MIIEFLPMAKAELDDAVDYYEPEYWIKRKTTPRWLNFHWYISCGL